MTAAGSRQRLQKKKQLLRGGFDLPLFVLVMIILMLGLVMMFSASYADGYYNHHGDGFYYIKRQGLWAALGLVVMYIMARVDYHRLRKFVLPVMAVTYLLLGVVLFTHPINGVRRWIDVGPINIQPSEIAKFAVVLLFAHLIAKFSNKRRNKMQTFKYGVAPFVLVLASVAALMIKEPHLSGTILILGIGCVMMFVGGTRIRWFVVGLSLAGAALLGMVLFTKVIVYAKNRLVYWLDPFKDPQHHGWQTIQSLYAIGSGGIMGLGLGNSRQKYLYVSEPQNDFVFPILCEELGLVGAVLVIVLFALLVWRGYVIAMRAPDRFGALMAVGLTTQVGLQAILNIAVTTNTIPNTGISLPFFSYGGSSLLMLLFQMGVILSISRYSSIEQT
ncbi:putative lipid II flippase FtsW [Ethanoligenens harbinense]|uniref:Probable peptidoglycan glycosyltransferase FtsW n=1 Tax=Ethanoligenens harbinense (strain DSM 18485 / JCM 12961 / CGMCC 1.5033 / YUAN-3) TaxID=663278 RepID=E6U397_ETHHY|nr:putative lipid II flippase FtsW [Ethanoligenens harbinense]ADU27569.1 cell cycle protein [Ethanoligenens harbinense YUAN-3]AVQ96615.1 putative lipid II flippase FtsW [Ethanoligenens harbinense YUAN-3]AYF39276.1 putative lipid II flippase FtsW [Ethanoligenens harbinense]AYF42100.1 putative lipid II flippase FtsW [Ethanoligenens harbinense]QCN92855.1 putative lipid II flippase FtsW [Ethanoligenens harbinense]